MMMKQNDNYLQEIVLMSDKAKAFDALTKHIDLWWGETDNIIARIGDEFTVRFGEASWSFRVTEFEPYSKVTWECIGGHPDFNAEWIGDTLYWNIQAHGDEVKISLLQDGLTPDMNCYNICNRGWDHYITNSLRAFLATGHGVLKFEG